MVENAALLSAVSSPRRREILRLLWEQELPAGTVHARMPDVTFGAVSLHLGLLRKAGILQVRSDGRRRLYQISPGARGPVGQILEPMWRDALWRLKLNAELEESRRGPWPRRRRTSGRSR